MKAMDRVSRGNGFKGVLSYNLDPAKHTTIIGGNLAAGDVGAMAREFRAIAALRSDIKKPVWHQALRLPKNEKIDSAKLAEIAEAYMQKMGFDVSKHQFVIIEDKLKAGQHAHIIANRVATDGTVYLGKNENLVSSRVCGELEVKFGLEQTKQATNAQRRAISKPRKTEIEQALRTGEQPPKLQIQTICDSVLDGADYNLDQFEAELYDQGVLARRTANAKGLVGYSFSLDGEVWFKGSQLGKNYSAKKLLERGLHDGQQARASQTLTDQTNQNTTANRANQQATASRDSGIESPKPAVNRAKPDFSKLAEKLKSRPSNSRKPVSNTQATESNGNSKRSGFGDRKFDVLGNARRISRAINEPVNTALAVAIFSSDFKVPNAEFVRYHDKHSRRTLIETPKAKGWVECTDSTAIAREPTAQANADILAAYAADRGWQRVCTTSTDKEFLEAFVDSCIERDIKLDLTPEQDKILGWGEPELEEADRLTM